MKEALKQTIERTTEVSVLRALRTNGALHTEMSDGRRMGRIPSSRERRRSWANQELLPRAASMDSLISQQRGLSKSPRVPPERQRPQVERQRTGFLSLPGENSQSSVAPKELELFEKTAAGESSAAEPPRPPSPGPNALETYRSWFTQHDEDHAVSSMTPSWWVGVVEGGDTSPASTWLAHEDPVDDLEAYQRELEVRMHRMWMQANGLQTSASFLDSTALDDTSRTTPSRLQQLVMHPISTRILIWNLIGPIFLVYDLIGIPLKVFPLPDYAVMDIISIIVAIYWTLDTIRGFFTGFETEDAVEMRLDKVAKHYLRTWFLLDFVTCSLDWAFIIAGKGGTFNKFWRTGRSLQAWKILQPVRLARIAKLNDQFMHSVKPLMDQVLSVPARIALKSINMGLVASIFCHYLACYWYFLGSDMDFEQNWLREHRLAGSEDFSTLYSICFHWALSQSGLSATDIYPTNASERTFSCFASFAWLIIIAVTINICNIWLSELRRMDGDRSSQRINITAYLNDHKVSRKLTYEVLRVFRVKYSAHRRRLHEEDITFFKDLPLSLKLCLHKEVYLPSLKSHVFFRFLGSVSECIPVMISHLAMRENHHLAGETVFMESTPARHMMHVLTGRLDYYAVRHDMAITSLVTGDWVCEPALWLNWITRGRLVTASSSEVMGVDVERFQAVLHDAKVHGKDIRSVQKFAEAICKYFIEQDPDTDLWRDHKVMMRVAHEVRGGIRLCKSPTTKSRRVQTQPTLA